MLASAARRNGAECGTLFLSSWCHNYVIITILELKSTNNAPYTFLGFTADGFIRFCVARKRALNKSSFNLSTVIMGLYVPKLP